MYEIGEESGELEFCHNPFSMPQGGMNALCNEEPHFRKKFGNLFPVGAS